MPGRKRKPLTGPVPSSHPTPRLPSPDGGQKPCLAGSSTGHPLPPLWSAATDVSSYENASSAEQLPLLSVMSFFLSGTPAGIGEEGRWCQRVLVLGRAGPAKPALIQDLLSHCCWGKGSMSLNEAPCPSTHADIHTHTHTNIQRETHTCAYTCMYTRTQRDTCARTNTHARTQPAAPPGASPGSSLLGSCDGQEVMLGWSEGSWPAQSVWVCVNSRGGRGAW